MEAAPGQQQLNICHCQPRALATTSRLAAALSTGLAIMGLLMAAPALGQQASAPIESEAKACATKEQHLVCELQQPGQAPQAKTLEQKNHKATVSQASLKRTALFNPELDRMLASGLLWTSYLSLPIIVSVAIWHDDHRVREQMAKLVSQIATLERIWQNS